MGDAASAVPALRRALTPGVEEKALARLARDPQITRQLEQFSRAVSRATDIRAALRDPRVMNVLLPALGMPDAVGQTGLAIRALLSDPKDSNGLLAKLPDRRWKSAAATLNLKEKGLAALRDPAVQARLAEGLRQVTWQKGLDADQPGISDAIYFQEHAAAAKSVYDVLGDPILRRVVTGALGLPAQIAIQPVETQARAVTSRLDLAGLKDERQVQKLMERYVVSAANSATAGGAGASLPGLLAGGLLV